MRKLIFGLGLLFAVTTWAALSEVDKAQLNSTRLDINGGFENGKAGWVASGGTFLPVSSGSNLLFGLGSATWDSSAASQTLKSKLVAIPEGLKGKNGIVRCTVKVPSGTATHKIEATDGTNVLTSINISSSSISSKNTANFVFPSSGSVQLQLKSVASDEPLIALDMCELGEADNVGNGNFATDPVAYTPTFTGWGTVSNVNFKSWRFGKFLHIEGQWTAGTTTAVEAQITLGFNGSNGTVTTSSTYPTLSLVGKLNGANPSTTTWGAGTVLAEASKNYMTFGRELSTSNGMTKLQGANFTSSVTYYIFASFEIEGWTSQTAYSHDVVASLWSGYHNNDCVWNRTSASFGDFTDDATCTLIERVNVNFGTVSTVGSVSPAISFTPVRTGWYKVCAAFNPTVPVALENIQFRLVHGASTVLDEGQRRSYNSVSEAVGSRQTLCGKLYASSVSAQTIKIQGAFGSGTGSLSQIGSPTIQWEIEAIVQQVPAPLLVNSLSSQYEGSQRLESATINCDASSSITSQAGSWISSIGNRATGCTLTIATGVFSGAPRCWGVPKIATSPGVNIGQGSSNTATSVIFYGRNAADSANQDFDADIFCLGPK